MAAHHRFTLAVELYRTFGPPQPKEVICNALKDAMIDGERIDASLVVFSDVEAEHGETIYQVISWNLSS